MAAVKKANEAAPAQTGPVLKEDNKIIKAAKERYKKDPNAFWRQCDYYTAKKVTGNDKMTWLEFCDAKIKGHTDYWTAKKTDPSLGARSQKPITDPEKLKKKQEEFRKMQEKMKKTEELLKQSEAALKSATVKK